MNNKAAIPLIVAAALALGTAGGGLTAKTSAARFQYLRLTPGVPQPGPLDTRPQHGYQACEAKPKAWSCRTFKAAHPDDGLRDAMTTLGAEGWELVSAVDEAEHLSYPKGLTYLFKRQNE